MVCIRKVILSGSHGIYKQSRLSMPGKSFKKYDNQYPYRSYVTGYLSNKYAQYKYILDIQKEEP
jgi:hypothetical protein